jgi:hypothetical protein
MTTRASKGVIRMSQIRSNRTGRNDVMLFRLVRGS